MNAQEKLAKLLGEKFETWFKKATFTDEGLSVETNFQADNIKLRFEDQLKQAFGFDPKITIQKQEPPKAAQIIQLDFWEDGKRASSNAILRSALFPALGRQKRQYLEEQMIDSVGGVTVFFTGKQFDQSDFDVYLEILNFARPFPLGKPVKFSAHGMLKMLGRSTGGKDHKWLHSVLIRLRSGTIDATDHKKRYFGGLIEGGIKDELMESYEITINPKFAVLFGFGMWSKIDIAQRRALGGKGSVAKALHAYYSSHTSLQLHAFETLAKLAGLRGTNKRDVKARLIKAHEEMKKVGFLIDFEITDAGIKIQKTNTPAQQKHIAKASPKATKNTTRKGTG
jgi:hypothetical protein